MAKEHRSLGSDGLGSGALRDHQALAVSKTRGAGEMKDPADTQYPSMLSDLELRRDARDWRGKAGTGDKYARLQALDLEAELRRRSTIGAPLEVSPKPKPKPKRLRRLWAWLR